VAIRRDLRDDVEFGTRFEILGDLYRVERVELKDD